jgi:uncharacterized protein YjiS (DUF1127 family)
MHDSDRQSLKTAHRVGGGLPRRSRSALFGWLFASLSRLSMVLRAELQSRRAIAELAMMDDQMLRDIGICRSEIEHAVRRPRGDLWLDDQLIPANASARSSSALAVAAGSLITGTTKLQAAVNGQNPQWRRSHR